MVYAHIELGGRCGMSFKVDVAILRGAHSADIWRVDRGAGLGLRCHARASGARYLQAMWAITKDHSYGNSLRNFAPELGLE